MSSIVTFYSYKGGAGRTMAMANIAVLLAQQGSRVLAVDFDLEAPGLDRYFTPEGASGLRTTPGLMDLLEDAGSHGGVADWRSYVAPLSIGGAELQLITAGRQDEHYNRRVLDFDWRYFFAEADGGQFIEGLRDAWKDAFDIVLIDSRTGITDTGGITTIQLPDVLVPVITPNRQSLDGTKDIVVRAQRARQELQFDRPPLLVFPLASRFDARTEYETSRRWLRELAREMRPAYDVWLPSSFAPISILERTKLPHVAYYTFGERLPVLTDGTSDPESLGYAYRFVAELIRHEFANAGDLLGRQSLPTTEDDRLAALAQRADEELERLPSDDWRRAWVILTRLVEPREDGSFVPVPLDLTGNAEYKNVVRQLRRLGVISVSGSHVELVKPQLFDVWDGLREWVLADTPFLRAMADVRAHAKEGRPVDSTLGSAIGWYVQRRQDLLRAEREQIAMSYRVRTRTRELAKDRARGTAVGRVILGAVGMVLGLAAWAALASSPAALVRWEIAGAVTVVGVVVAFVAQAAYRAMGRAGVAVTRHQRTVCPVVSEPFLRDMADGLAVLGYRVATVPGGSVFGDRRSPGPSSDLPSLGPEVLAYVIPGPVPDVPAANALGVLEGPASLLRKVGDFHPGWHPSATLANAPDDFFLATDRDAGVR